MLVRTSAKYWYVMLTDSIQDVELAVAAAAEVVAIVDVDVVVVKKFVELFQTKVEVVSAAVVGFTNAVVIFHVTSAINRPIWYIFIFVFNTIDGKISCRSGAVLISSAFVSLLSNNDFVWCCLLV